MQKSTLKSLGEEVELLRAALGPMGEDGDDKKGLNPLQLQELMKDPQFPQLEEPIKEELDHIESSGVTSQLDELLREMLAPTLKRQRNADGTYSTLVAATSKGEEGQIPQKTFAGDFYRELH